MKGRWVIYWEPGAIGSRRLCWQPSCVSSVTEKIIRFTKDVRYPKQIRREDLIADFDDREMAKAKLLVARNAYDAEWVSHRENITALERAYREANDDRREAASKAALDAL